MVSECFVADNSRLPADATPDEHLATIWVMLEDLGERHFQRGGNKFGRPVEKAVDVITLEDEEPEVRKRRSLEFQLLYSLLLCVSHRMLP